LLWLPWRLWLPGLMLLLWPLLLLWPPLLGSPFMGTEYVTRPEGSSEFADDGGERGGERACNGEEAPEGWRSPVKREAGWPRGKGARRAKDWARAARAFGARRSVCVGRNKKKT
jgi:hypothetical protein